MRCDYFKFSEKAIKKISELCLENPNKQLRMYVKGGGCSGLVHSFILEDLTELYDYEFSLKYNDVSDFRLVIDPISLQYFRGATIDYITGFAESRFIVINPNLNNRCRCGKSFG